MQGNIPKFNSFLIDLKDRYILEKYTYAIQGKQSQFYEIWNQYENIFKDE